MTVGIVKGLEVVDVDHRHRHRNAVTLAAPPLLDQPFIEAAPVVDLGQTVVAGQLQHFQLGQFAFGNVLMGYHDMAFTAVAHRTNPHDEPAPAGSGMAGVFVIELRRPTVKDTAYPFHRIGARIVPTQCGAVADAQVVYPQPVLRVGRAIWPFKGIPAVIGHHNRAVDVDHHNHLRQRIQNSLRKPGLLIHH